MRFMKWLTNKISGRGLAMAVAGIFGLLFAGCAGGYYTGAYYSPDYSPYYTNYGYAGGPYYYGYTPGFIGGFAISSGNHYHRYYGHHHFRSERSYYRGRSTGSSHARTTTHVHKARHH
jgi:hypothetical protein